MTNGSASHDTCPECGGDFRTLKVPPIAEASKLAKEKTALREKLTAARGALQRCQGCGYQRRAHDRIEPADSAA